MSLNPANPAGKMCHVTSQTRVESENQSHTPKIIIGIKKAKHFVLHIATAVPIPPPTEPKKVRDGRAGDVSL